MLHYSIPNFEKYHPRNDYKTIPWIRFEVNTPMDCKVMELTIAEKWMFVCLLCLFAQSGDHVRETNVKQITKFSGLKAKQVEVGLEKLNDFGMIELHVRDTYGPRTAHVRYERTNERTNEQKSVEFDFEKIKATYKKATGVSAAGNAKQRFLNQIKTAADYAALLQSIANYESFLKLPENSWRKPKQSLGTFLGTASSGFFWRDFIELDVPRNEVENLDHLKDENWDIC